MTRLSDGSFLIVWEDTDSGSLLATKFTMSVFAY
jgi:hypothetical protein